MARSPKYHRRGARLFRWTAWLLVSGVLLVGGGVFWLERAPLGLPPQVGTYLERRLDRVLAPAGLTAKIAHIRIGVRDGFRPAVTLSGLSLRGATEDPILTLDRIDAVFSAEPLMWGKLDVRALRLEGLALTIQSDSDGRLSLRLGDKTVAQNITSLSDLIAELRKLASQGPIAGIATIGVDDLAIRYEDALRSTAVSSTGGTLRLSRTGPQLAVDLDMGEIDGLSDGANVGRISASLTSDAPNGAARTQVALRGIVPASVAGLAGPSPLSDLLSRLAAPVSLTLRAAVDEGGKLADMTGNVSVGEGTIDLPGLNMPMPLDWMRGDVTLNVARDRLNLTNLNLSSQKLALGGNLTLIASPEDPIWGPILAQVALSRLVVTEPTAFPEPMGFDGLWADAQYDRRSGAVRLGSLSILRGDMRVEAKGSLVPGSAQADRQIAVDLTIKEAEKSELIALWPPSVKPGTRAWLADNIHNGTLSDLHVALRSSGAGDPDLGLSFRFKDAEVKPLKKLPSFRNGRGHGQIINHELSIVIDEADLDPAEGGTIHLTSGLVRMPDLRVHHGDASIQFSATGKTATVLGLFEGPAFKDPDDESQKSPPQFNPLEATGVISLTTKLTVPLRPKIKGEDIGISATGTLVGFTNDTIVPGKSFEAGTLAIEATATNLRVSGPATLNGIPMTVAFERAIGRVAPDQRGSVVTVDTALTPALAQEFKVPLPPNALSGSGTLKAIITTLPDTRPTLELTGDLTGNSLSIPSLGLQTARRSGGTLAVSGQLGPRTTLSSIDLRAPGLLLQASADVPGSGGGGTLSFQRLKIGKWLDVSGRIASGKDGEAGPVTLTSGTVDLRSAPFGKSGGAGAKQPPLTLDLDRLVISPTIALTSVRGALTAQGDGDLTASVNGKAPVNVRLGSASAGRPIRLTSADAGAVFAAADVFENARGGSLDLTLTPQPGVGRYRGNLHVQDTAVLNTPVMAELLSAISVVGALEQMSGAGITFSDVQADFDLAPGLIYVRAASAEGPSLGISLDGNVNLTDKTVDLQGVVSPIYFLNQVGSFMTRRGEGLLGVNYSLRGPMAKPNVAVNPLSMLTPGFLRNIFRRPITSGASDSGN